MKRFLGFWLMGLCAVSAWGAGAQEEARSAPLNPAFLAFQTTAAETWTQRRAPSEHPLGWRPGPVDLSHLRTAVRIPKALPKAFDASFDLRTQGKLTAIKNQNPYGTCWAHATCASMESALLPGETNDFSENNMVNLHGFDWGFDDGGNASVSMAYLTRWDGPVNESDDPYPDEGGSTGAETVRKHVQQVYLIPPKASATDNDAIKQALLDYGALYVNYYHDDTYYNSTYKSYYYSGASNGNHAVAIVGWNDDFSASQFNSAPAGNGAYIVRNSWGTSWGDSGYFYVSYYDSIFARDEVCAFHNAESTSNYARVYAYDPLGWVSSIGTGSGTTFWGANLFAAEAEESLSAVGFYAASTGTAYQIYVYKGVTAGSPRSGTLAVSNSGTRLAPGYCTIDLSAPVALTNGQRFSIVLKLTTPGNNYPLPFEYAYAGYSSAASASSGQSYYSSAGSTWTELTNFEATANCCIKGYAASDVVPDYGMRDDGGANLPTLTYWYDGLGSDVTEQGSNFNGRALGTRSQIYLKGSAIKTWKSGSGDVTGTTFHYKIWEDGAGEPGTYSTRSVGWTSDDGGGNQTWANFGAEINAMSGLVSGSYNLKVMFTVAGTGVPGILTNGPFTATFDIAPVQAPGNLRASATNETDFTAAWDAVSGATGYRLDVGTNATFSGGGSSVQSVLASNGATVASIVSDGWTAYDISGTTYARLLSSSSVVTSPAFSTVGFTNLTMDMKARTYGGASGTSSNITVSISTNDGTSWTVMGVVAPWVSSMNSLPTLTNTANLGHAQTRIRWQTLGATGSAGVGITNLVVQGWSAGSMSAYVPGYSNRAVSGTSQIVTGLTANSTYYFRVRTEAAFGTSTNSATANVTTLEEAVPGTPPTMDAIPAQITYVGGELEYVVTAQEPDSDPVTFACTSAVDVATWDFDANTGDFLFIPTTNEMGTNVFSFTATDKDGTSAAELMSVKVYSAAATNEFTQWVEDQEEDPEDPDFDEGADVDGDGQTTYDEFLADTDPAASNSVLKMEGLSADLEQFSFPASPARYYQLEYCTDITNQAGTLVTSNLGWGVSGMVITNTVPGSWFGVIRVLLDEP